MVRLRAALVATSALVVLAAAAAAGGATAQPQRVTVFGDSQLAGIDSTPSARAMLAKGIDLDLRTAVCRRLAQDSCPYQGNRPSTVLDEVRDMSSSLGSVVVILVGYNDFESEFAANVDRLMKAMLARGVTRVLWLTLTERRADWVRMNDTLRAEAKGWPQLEVLDWRDAADPTWFNDGDIHLTPTGALGLASYLHVALFARGIALPTATAPAAPARVPLQVTIRGTGAVTVGSVRCRTSCSRLLAVGTRVRLTARAPAGSVFDRWSGACIGKRTSCSVKVARRTAVVARFRAAVH